MKSFISRVKTYLMGIAMLSNQHVKVYRRLSVLELTVN